LEGCDQSSRQRNQRMDPLRIDGGFPLIRSAEKKPRDISADLSLLQLHS
jgi:hypothetical protein